MGVPTAVDPLRRKFFGFESASRVFIISSRSSLSLSCSASFSFDDFHGPCSSHLRRAFTTSRLVRRFGAPFYSERACVCASRKIVAAASRSCRQCLLLLLAFIRPRLWGAVHAGGDRRSIGARVTLRGRMRCSIGRQRRATVGCEITVTSEPLSAAKNVSRRRKIGP